MLLCAGRPIGPHQSTSGPPIFGVDSVVAGGFAVPCCRESPFFSSRAFARLALVLSKRSISRTAYAITEVRKTAPSRPVNADASGQVTIFWFVVILVLIWRFGTFAKGVFRLGCAFLFLVVLGRVRLVRFGLIGAICNRVEIAWLGNVRCCEESSVVAIVGLACHLWFSWSAVVDMAWLFIGISWWMNVNCQFYSTISNWSC